MKAAELPEGEGLGIAVNTLGGSYAEETAAALQKVFPKAYIKEVGQDEDLAEEIPGSPAGPGSWPWASGAATEPSAPRPRPPSNIPFPCWSCRAERSTTSPGTPGLPA